MNIFSVNLSKTKFQEAWEIQKQIFNLRNDDLIEDVLLFTEHENVYTLGKSSDVNHLLASELELSEKKIDLFAIDRGGDVTYHGPGQIVCYPILKLSNYYSDIHRYLREIEEVIILTLKDFAISAERKKDFTGVWIENEKIAAIGVKVSKWITMHGFALNVNTDLNYFDRIIPCGIFQYGVTSMSKILKQEIAISDVEASLIKNFCKVFNVISSNVSKNELFDKLMVKL